ncbi:23 kDa integral membrane protein-like [Teleopsis dalmanni]|uniref:23 kDa integral membrane protein-like n=1 Tax=Teleopsis dalmanni TaxID=139649 RepID=UPI0018CEC550|nr:23 kDa integral membrane protein-like [Teleopsis dalmanni]
MLMFHALNLMATMLGAVVLGFGFIGTVIFGNIGNETFSLMVTIGTGVLCLSVLSCLMGCLCKGLILWLYGLCMFALGICTYMLLYYYVRPFETVVNVEYVVNESWNHTVVKTNQKLYTSNPPIDFTLLEKMLHCCGKTGPDDYDIEDLEIPSSCYVANYLETMEAEVYIEGCVEKFTKVVHKFFKAIIVVCWPLMMIEYFAAFYSFCSTVF